MRRKSGWDHGLVINLFTRQSIFLWFDVMCSYPLPMHSCLLSFFQRSQAPASVLLVVFLLQGCQTIRPADDAALIAARLARKEAILAEQPGDYYIGRRYHLEPTRYWGYLRSPKKGWATARLVIINESIKKLPGRLPLEIEEEKPTAVKDHNYEYRITGHYSGREAYDPSSNMILPEFVLEDYELIDSDPGWLFDPTEIPGRHRPQSSD
jgi:hypothetical protein